MREDRCFTPPLKMGYALALVALLLSAIFIVRTVRGETPEITKVQSIFYGFQNQGYEMQTRYYFYGNGSLFVENSKGSQFFFPTPKFQPNGTVVVSLSENETHVIQQFNIAGGVLNLSVFYKFSNAQDEVKISLIGNTTDEDSEIEYEFENPKGAPIHNTTTTYRIGNIVYDWTDLEGATEFLFAINKLKVKLNSTFNLDPSIVSAVTTYASVDHSFQRKIAYANGRWWVFYRNGSYIVFRSSTDGASWSSQTSIDATDYSAYFSIWQFGNYIDYALMTSNLTYRRGLLNSVGTITWNDTKQTVIPSTTQNIVSIAVDTSNYPYIVYYQSSYFRVVKSQFNNGTWLNATGYPKTLSGSGIWRGSIVPLTSNKMYVVYTKGSITRDYLFGRLYNGTDWEGEEQASSSKTAYRRHHSVVSKVDDVYLVFLRDPDDNPVFVQRVYGSGWGSEVTIKDTSRYGLSLSKTSDKLFLSSYATSYVYIDKYESESWSEYFSISVGVLSSLTTVSIYEETSENEISVIWATNSPSYVKIEKFTTVEAPPNPDPPSTTGTFPEPDEELGMDEVAKKPSILPQLGFWGLLLSVGLIAIGGIIVGVKSGSRRRKPLQDSRGMHRAPKKRRVPPRG